MDVRHKSVVSRLLRFAFDDFKDRLLEHQALNDDMYHWKYDQTSPLSLAAFHRNQANLHFPTICDWFRNKDPKIRPSCFFVWACSNDSLLQEDVWMKDFLQLLNQQMREWNIDAEMDGQVYCPANETFDDWRQRHIDEADVVFVFGSRSFKHQLLNDISLRSKICRLAESAIYKRIMPVLMSGYYPVCFPESSGCAEDLCIDAFSRTNEDFFIALLTELFSCHDIKLRI